MKLWIALPVLVAALAPAAGRAEPEPVVRPPSRALARVAVVRQPGVQTYEDLIEEFRGKVQAAVRVVGADASEKGPLRDWLRSYRPSLVLAVGQQAYDLVRDAPVPVVPVLALGHRPLTGQPAVSLTVPTTSVLAAFLAARPGISRVGALHGPGARAMMASAQAEAWLLGVDLVTVQASSAEDAVSRLRSLGRQVQGLWLVPDLQTLSPQVLQYALMLQFRRRLPVLGATRRQVMQGALFSLDHDPQDLGRQAAQLANQLLARGRLDDVVPPLPDRLSLNLTTAQRIGVGSRQLRRRADRVYQ